jgi:hypothetical protein
MRLFDPAPAVTAGQIAAGVISTALADLAVGIDRDEGDRVPLPAAQLPPDGADDLVADPGGELVQAGDQGVAGPGSVCGYRKLMPPGSTHESRRQRGHIAEPGTGQGW